MASSGNGKSNKYRSSAGALSYQSGTRTGSFGGSDTSNLMENTGPISGKRMESVYDPRSGSGKEFVVQDPGMHIHVGQPGMEAVSRDAEGLRPLDKPLPAFPDLMVTEKEFGTTATAHGPGQPQGNWWTRMPAKRRAIIIAGLSSFLIFIVVIAAVFGSKAAQQQQSTNVPNNSTSNSTGLSGAPKDDRSTRGAYKGTGLTVLHSKEDPDGNSITELLVYQSFTGKLMMQPINASLTATDFTNDNNFTAVDPKVDLLGSPIPFNVTAANGTGIAGITALGPTQDSDVNGIYIIVYVAPNGTLCDLWSTNDAINQPWTPGSLGARNFQAPQGDGQRAALTLEAGTCFTTKNPGYAVRLWAGGLDGQLHHYNYDWFTKTWSAQDVALHGASAYSGATTAASPNGDFCANKTVTLMTDPSGKLMYVPVNQSDAQAANGNDASPTAFGSGFSADKNSTLAVAQTIQGSGDSFWLFYSGGASVPNTPAVPSTSMQMMQVGFDDLVTGKPQFSPQTVNGVSTLPDSDLSILSMTFYNSIKIVWNKQWIFYQANETSIDWVLFGGNYPKGNILS